MTLPYPMGIALAQAGLALPHSEPNPRVGAVLVAHHAQTLGHTQPPGGAHAEVMALRAAMHAGWKPADFAASTLVVTLEPCCHYGRTGPCTQAILEAGIGHVVVAALDPNPQVKGQGVALLRAAGVRVDVLPANDPQAQAARELSIGFFSRHLRGRPWVRLKMAASLDGRTALASGESQWITGATARADGHAYRARASCILTGVGTVLADDPQLNVRHSNGQAASHQPRVAVLDSRLETPPTAKLLVREPGQVTVFAAEGNASTAGFAERRERLVATGATVQLVANDALKPGKLDLIQVLRELHAAHVQELHVEAGAQLSGSLWAAACIDELLVYMAPKLLGDGMPLLHLPPLSSLQDAQELVIHSAQTVGTDLRLLVRNAAADRFAQTGQYAPAV